MKEILKRMYYGANRLIESLISIISVLLFSSYKGDSYFKKQRKNRKQNDCCYIFGNGSSLSKFLECSIIKDINNIMAVNFFASSPYFKIVKPNHYIVLDNILIGTAKRKFSQEKVNALYEDLFSVSWPLTFFFPSNGDKKIVERLTKNPNITIVVYNMTPISGIKSISHWLYRHSFGMPWPQNISNAAVFCALNSGFKKIYLYGIEHSWLKSFDVNPETHRIFCNDGHFYEKDNIRWFQRGDYCEWLKNIHRAMLSHFELREYADSIGAKIINKTPASFVEAYEFDEY